MVKNVEFSVLSVVGVDIGKDVFHFVGFNDDGTHVLRKKIKRLALVRHSRGFRAVLSVWKRARALILSAGRCASWVLIRASFRQNTSNLSTKTKRMITMMLKRLPRQLFASICIG